MPEGAYLQLIFENLQFKYFEARVDTTVFERLELRISGDSLIFDAYENEDGVLELDNREIYYGFDGKNHPHPAWFNRIPLPSNPMNYTAISFDDDEEFSSEYEYTYVYNENNYPILKIEFDKTYQSFDTTYYEYDCDWR